jgi:hypothetical protein
MIRCDLASGLVSGDLDTRMSINGATLLLGTTTFKRR